MLSVSEFLKSPAESAKKATFYFYGEEPFLTQEGVEGLITASIGKMTDFNTSIFYGDEAEPVAILDALSTLTFGGSRRLVLVRRAQELSTAALESFLPYLEQPSSASLLVFVGGDSVDGRRQFYKKIDAKGCLVKSERLKGRDLHHWLEILAKKRQKILDKGAAESIELLVGTSLFALDQAIERLALMSGDEKSISQSMVRAALSDTHEGILWSLTEALAKSHLGQSLLALKRILRQKEIASGVLLLGTLAGYYRRLLRISLALAQGLDDRDMVRLAQLSPGALYFNKSEANRWLPSQLEKALGLIAKADKELKSSGLPTNLILSNVVVELCQLQRQPKTLKAA